MTKTFHEFCIEELNIHSALAPWAVDHTWQYQQKRIEELEAKQNNNGWISVDERLPEKACFCLIWVGGDATEAIYSAESGSFHYASGVDDCPRPATHWQPLPFPPAPEQAK